MRGISIRRDFEQRLPSRVRNGQAGNGDCERQSVSDSSATSITPARIPVCVLQRFWSLTNNGDPSLLLTFPIPARCGQPAPRPPARAKSSAAAEDAAVTRPQILAIANVAVEELCVVQKAARVSNIEMAAQLLVKP